MILFQSLLLVISTDDDDDWAMLCFDIKSAVKVTSSPGCKIVVDDILVLHSALTHSLLSPPHSWYKKWQNNACDYGGGAGSGLDWWSNKYSAGRIIKITRAGIYRRLRGLRLVMLKHFAVR